VLKPLIAAKAKERQATSTGGTKPQLREISHEAENGRTDESLAEIAGKAKKVKKLAFFLGVSGGAPCTA